MSGILSRTGTAALWLVALGIGLASCSSSNKTLPESNIFPAKYKDDILRVFPQLVADPTNVHNASISDPVFNPGGPIKVYYVCVRANARDDAHQYIGIKQYAGYFYDGHINQLVEAPAEPCDKAVYKPFPELEKLCLGNVCH